MSVKNKIIISIIGITIIYYISNVTINLYNLLY